MSVYWPSEIPTDLYPNGLVSGTGDDKDDATVAARRDGKMRTSPTLTDTLIKKAPKPCGEILHISLFFDGTNNHLDWDAPSDGVGQNKRGPSGLRLDPEIDDIPPPKDIEHATHSNIARLFRACPEDRRLTHSIYLPGVGTPFHELGEHLFSTGGKAFAHGLEERVCWAYLQILQRLYLSLGRSFIPPDTPTTFTSLGHLFDDETVQTLCQGKLSRPLPPTSYTAESTRSFTALNEALDQLQGTAGQIGLCNEDYLKHNVPDPKKSGLMRHIKFVFINVFGFSRGAATARVFVNKLLKAWAPEHKLCKKIDYRVNFVGLFDSVASASDKFLLRPNIETANYSNFMDRYFLPADGHGRWCTPENLDIASEVRHCRHFFAVHEQRASFPLEVIANPRVLKVAYPGVHSDVGGGYPAKDQGKARAGHTHLLSKIPLHDMYIAALKAGVPLLAGQKIAEDRRARDDLALSTETIDAFNAWLGERSWNKTTVAEALATGFRESVAWRAYRNRPNSSAYLDQQEFFRRAPQDALLPEELDRLLKAALKKDEEYLSIKKGQLTPTLRKVLQQHKATKADSRMIEEASMRCANRLLAQLARENGVAHADSRPGEDAWDLLTNDQSDLIEAAQDFQLLACNLLNPSDRVPGVRPKPEDLHVDVNGNFNDKLALPLPPKPEHWGCVFIGKVDRYGAVVALRWAIDRDERYTTTKEAPLPRNCPLERRLETSLGNYVSESIKSVRFKDDSGDLLFLPEKSNVVAEIKTILGNADTSKKEVYTLFDYFIHDSRAWFRVPRHHELSPGGYGFLRVFFTGKQRYDDYLIPTPVAQNPTPFPTAASGLPPNPMSNLRFN